MTKSEQVCAVIERETGQAVTEATPLELLHVDSLEFVDLLLQIENETGKAIPGEKVARLQTVGDIVGAA